MPGNYAGFKAVIKTTYCYDLRQGSKVRKSSLPFFFFPLLNRKSILNYKNKMLLYKACIRPILTYDCQIFRKCAKSHLKRLQVIQNKMVKFIYYLNIRHSTERLHADHNQQTIMEIISDFTRSFNERCRR